MKTTIRLLLGLCIVITLLVLTAVRSRLFMLGGSLYLVYVLLAALSARIRTHFPTREAQVIMLFASLFSMLVVLAGAVLVVRVPLSKTLAIGLENHLLYYDWLPTTLQIPSLVGKVGPPPQPVVSLRSSGNTMTLFPPLAWSRSSVPTVAASMVLVVPTGLFWLVRMRLVRPGRCTKCDYDLTGNVSGVCPECGTKVEPDHASATDESHPT